MAPPVRRTRDHPSPADCLIAAATAALMLAWRRATPPTSPWTTSRSSTGPSGADGKFANGRTVAPTDHRRVRPTDHRNNAATTGESDPAMAAFINVESACEPQTPTAARSQTCRSQIRPRPASSTCIRLGVGLGAVTRGSLVIRIDARDSTDYATVVSDELSRDHRTVSARITSLLDLKVETWSGGGRARSPDRFVSRFAS